MHPYLTKLKIREEGQRFFEPFLMNPAMQDLFFDYGDAEEHYGFAFHRIPVSENCWQAGNLDFNMVRQVFICSSAMEAIAFYHYKYPVYKSPDNLLFLSVGCTPNATQFRWISKAFYAKEIQLVFGTGILERIGELKTAAALCKLPLDVSLSSEVVFIQFRLTEYVLPVENFSLSNFEKLSGFRFKIKTSHPKNGSSYFEQLKAFALNY